MSYNTHICEVRQAFFRATAFTFWYRRSEKEPIAINLKKN
jgi:hypothetical protein